MILLSSQEALRFFLRSIFAGNSSVAPLDEAAALFLLLLVTDGTKCSCRHRPGRCPCCHRRRCFKTMAAAAKKGLLLSWSQVAANFPCFTVPFSANLHVLPCGRAKKNHYKHHRQHHNKGHPGKVRPATLGTRS